MLFDADAIPSTSRCKKPILKRCRFSEHIPFALRVREISDQFRKKSHLGDSGRLFPSTAPSEPNLSTACSRSIFVQHLPGAEKKHVHFNNRVEQCITIDKGGKDRLRNDKDNSITRLPSTLLSQTVS